MTDLQAEKVRDVAVDLDPPQDSRGVRSRAKIIELGEAYTIPALIGVLVVLFSLLPATSATFPTWANASAVLSSQAIVAILTLAALVPLVTNRYDLSIGANLIFSTVLAAEVMAHGGGGLLGIAAGVFAAVVVGLLNGFIVTKLGVNDVVTTLGISTILVGLSTAVTGGQSITANISQGLVDFAASTLFGIPVVVITLIVLAAIVYLWFDYTPSGRHLFMLGANPRAALLIGLNTNRLTVIGFTVAGLLAGIAGVLQLGRTGAALPGAVDSYTLPALAAAFLSQAAIRPGRANVPGAMTAVLFLAVLNAGLNLAGAPPYVSYFVNGTALILGISLSYFIGQARDRYQARRAT
jgi:ribose transport system permease protein